MTGKLNLPQKISNVVYIGGNETAATWYLHVIIFFSFSEIEALTSINLTVLGS